MGRIRIPDARQRQRLGVRPLTCPIRGQGSLPGQPLSVPLGADRAGLSGVALLPLLSPNGGNGGDFSCPVPQPQHRRAAAGVHLDKIALGHLPGAHIHLTVAQKSGLFTAPLAQGQPHPVCLLLHGNAIVLQGLHQLVIDVGCRGLRASPGTPDSLPQEDPCGSRCPQVSGKNAYLQSPGIGKYRHPALISPEDHIYIGPLRLKSGRPQRMRLPFLFQVKHHPVLPVSGDVGRVVRLKSHAFPDRYMNFLHFSPLPFWVVSPAARQIPTRKFTFFNPSSL